MYMERIYKYPISLGLDTNFIKMPKGARVLSVIYQGGPELQLYAIIDDETEYETVTFEVYGTGRRIRHTKNKAHLFIATVEQGPFVWHIFKLI